MMTPVRVLLVSSHPTQYGPATYREYVADARLDVTVAYLSMSGAELGYDPDFGIEVGWDVPLLEGYPWIHPANVAPRCVRTTFVGLINPGLWRLVHRGTYDVVICHGYDRVSYWIAALAARTSGKRFAFTTDAHSLRPRDGSAVKEYLKRWIVPRILRRGDGVLVPSSKAVRFMHALGVPASRTFLTEYAVDNRRFAQRAAESDARAVRSRWNVPPAAFVALFVGKLVPWKRPRDLIDAVASTANVFAVLAGEGSERPALELRARECGVESRVRFVGFANQRTMPGLYAAADVLVLPSSYEPFGVVVNEAFACGKPAIISDQCGSADDLVRDGETGYVYPVGDLGALTERLTRLVKSKERCAQLGRNAAARVARWDPAQNADSLARACIQMVAQGVR